MSNDPINSCWTLADVALEHSPRILLHGNPGIGKTHAAYYSFLNGRDVYSATVTQFDTAASFRGMFIPKGGDFVWHDGIGVRAWINGARLVVNEIDKAGDDLLGFLHCLFDDPQITRIDLPDGRTVRPHAMFQVVATMNGNPDTDLDSALRDRFPVCIHANDVAPGAIEVLPEDLRHVARKTALVADKARQKSVRRFMEFARLREKTNNEMLAAQLVFGASAREFIDALAIGRTAAITTNSGAAA